MEEVLPKLINNKKINNKTKKMNLILTVGGNDDGL
jgi:hypothetical protein